MKYILFFVLICWFVLQTECRYCIKPCTCGDTYISCLKKISTEQFVALLNETDEEITTITLQHQNISYFNTSLLKNATNLRTLDLQFNNLKHFPENVNTYLPSLRVIGLDNNQLSTIEEDTFNSYKNIQVMKLYMNKFNKIKSKAFSKITELRELHISNSQITKIAPYALQNLNKLEKIDLSYNRIVKIENDVFSNLPNLNLLQFKYNKIATLNTRAFYNLPNLRSLQLQYNKITTLGSKAFQKMGLHTLDLRSNNITIIPPDVFNRTTIRKIRLFGNNIHCNCLGLYALYQAVDLKGLQGFCNSPSSVKGKDLTKIIEYEENICNKNRLCYGKNTYKFQNTTLTYEQLCVSQKKPKPTKSLEMLYIIIISISCLLILTIILVTYLCFRLHKLRRTVKLEVMEELADLPPDHDIRKRSGTTVLGNGDVLYVESNVNTKKDQHYKDAIMLTKLKTPALQQKVFNTDRRCSIESDLDTPTKRGRYNTTAFEFALGNNNNGSFSKAKLSNGIKLNLDISVGSTGSLRSTRIDSQKNDLKKDSKSLQVPNGRYTNKGLDIEGS